MLTVLNEDLMLLEFNSPEKAKWVLESGRRSFNGGVLQLEWWSPETGCIRSKGAAQETWIRVLGLPLHLWTPEILRKLGDACGGFVAVDKVTERKNEMKWARMLIKSEGKFRPSTVNILEGPRSYELQIWWEIPPWVTGVYTGVPRGAEKNQKEEDEVVAHVAKRVGLPSLSCKDVQDSGTENEWGSSLVGAVKVNYVSGSLMKNRGGVYVGEGGTKRAGFCRLGEGILQHSGLPARPARLSGPETFGQIPNRSKSQTGQRVGCGLKKLKQLHRPKAISGGLGGPVSNGPNKAGTSTCPRTLKEDAVGYRGVDKVLNVARVVSKGITYVSKAEKRLGDGGSRLGAVASVEALTDPAWICARDPWLIAQEGTPNLGGTSGFERCWEVGLGAATSDSPLMGFHQVQEEEGCPAVRSFAIVEAGTRCPEEDDPEALRIQAQGSKFETVSPNIFSPSIFSVFGRPLLSGDSSGLGNFQEYEDLGEMEPLRVVTVDGREWGKGLAEVPTEGGQTAVGLGPLSEEPSVVNLEGKGYNTWEDSCLIKFSEFLGVTTAGFEEEILELLRKMDVRQNGDKRKGDHAETRCERELRKLECTINYNGKGQFRGGRDRGNSLLKLK